MHISRKLILNAMTLAVLAMGVAFMPQQAYATADAEKKDAAPAEKKDDAPKADEVEKPAPVAPAPAPAATPAAAPAATSAAPQSPWQKRCQDLKEGEKTVGRYCEAVQQLFLSQKDKPDVPPQRLAEIAVGFPPVEKGKATGVVVLPLGILVQEKIRVLVDDKKLVNIPVRFCEQGGCVAIFSPDKGDLEKMGKGKVLAVIATAMGGQDVRIELPLDGFSTIVDDVKPKS